MQIRATTILGIVRDGRGALGGDGLVTAGSTIVKSNASKIRRLADGAVLAGFAGTASDGLQLFERFEEQLEGAAGNLRRAAVGLAKEWRSDRVLRRLEAQLAVLNREGALLVTGTGDVIEPEDGIVAIGSGAPYALAACRALLRGTSWPLPRTVEESLTIAAGICIYSGGRIQVLELSDPRVS